MAIAGKVERHPVRSYRDNAECSLKTRVFVVRRLVFQFRLFIALIEQ